MPPSFQIDAQDKITPHNLQVPAGTLSIEFVATQACTLSFPDAGNCFGMSSVPLNQGSNIVGVVTNATTDGSVLGVERQATDTFEITFGN